MNLALNNLQRMICHKTQQTKPNQSHIIFLNRQKNKACIHVYAHTLTYYIFTYTKDKTYTDKRYSKRINSNRTFTD